MADRSGWWGTRPENGSIGQPRSALNLRLLLAMFGLIFCAAMAVVSFRIKLPVVGWALVVLAVIALIDIVVIQRRRVHRRRVQRRRMQGRGTQGPRPAPGERGSLFE
jgi:hypothetical protein